MAVTTVKGTQITLRDSTPFLKSDAAFRHGRVRVTHDTYEASAAAGAAGDGTQIKLGSVPAGALILGGQLNWDAMGTGVRLFGVGDQYDSDRFLAVAAAGLLISTASRTYREHITAQGGPWGDCGNFNVMLSAVGVGQNTKEGSGVGYRYSCDQDILVTIGPEAATGTISLTIWYSTE